MNTRFILISFEGPDPYSQAGGLGVRMAGLSRALAEAGFETHLCFIGDPDLPESEAELDGRLTLHRFCQSISRKHPRGVYDGEAEKKRDFETRVPEWIAQTILPKNTKQTIFMCEEWQTADLVLTLSNLVPRSLILWNANNVFGFDRINWKRLKQCAAITTVSRYMKELMRPTGMTPLVIPNGIANRWFAPIEPSLSAKLRKACGSDLLLAKVGRFDPAKQWLMAIESLAQLKEQGLSAKLVMRGDHEPHGAEVRDLTHRLGLKLQPITLPKNSSIQDVLDSLERAKDCDIFDLQFFVSEEMLRTLYASADAVLANSSHEPFGLVGLEVMACGGIAVTGSTGEEYAEHLQNAIVVDSSDPAELTSNLAYLSSNLNLANRIRLNAHESARRFLWPNILEILKLKISYLQSRKSGNGDTSNY